MGIQGFPRSPLLSLSRFGDVAYNKTLTYVVKLGIGRMHACLKWNWVRPVGASLFTAHARRYLGLSMLIASAEQMLYPTAWRTSIVGSPSHGVFSWLWKCRSPRDQGHGYGMRYHSIHPSFFSRGIE